jgi:transcriptional regulator with XRE-family HTH domain
MPTVGSKILYYRLKQGLSRSQFAVLIGWSASNYALGEWELRGMAENAKLKTLKRMAAACGIHVCELIDGDLPDDAADVFATAGYTLEEVLGAAA